MSDQLKKIMIGVSAGFVLLLVILFIASSCQHKVKDYSAYEKEMIKAAKAHFKNHEDDLPTENKQTSEYTLKEMIENKEITDYIKAFDDESLKCEGSVTVTNNNGYQLYTTELDCGDKYTSKTLREKIIEDSLVESGQGLYELGNEYVFKGNRINNYATFNGETYRIISIEEDGNINLLQQKTEMNCTWDTHYNPELNQYGLNVYYQDGERPSTINECLAKIYKNNFTDESKAFMATQKSCYGARSKDDITTDGSTECSLYKDNEPLSLIAAYEYIRASIDTNCINISSKSCSNYNWIRDNKTTTFLITPDSTRSDFVYYKNNTGLSTTTVTNTMYTLVKVQIDKKTNYTKGSGTEEDPYIITTETTKKK